MGLLEVSITATEREDRRRYIDLAVFDVLDESGEGLKIAAVEDRNQHANRYSVFRTASLSVSLLSDLILSAEAESALSGHAQEHVRRASALTLGHLPHGRRSVPRPYLASSCLLH
jgi:hypothetical protein